MRRKDREITDINDIISIIEKCDCCRVAIYDEKYPYIIPLNFGLKYENNKITLYFHCANEGKKLDLIKRNPNVSFEMDCSHKLLVGETACDYSMEYESVIGSGVATIVNENKADVLTHLMKNYSDEKSFHYDENVLKAVTVFKIDVSEITAKRLKRK